MPPSDKNTPPKATKPKVAVALQQTGGPESLPKIAATGRGKLAEQILELAYANGIKVREDGDLAEILATLDNGSDIPSEAIVAVAEILTKVYEANAALAARDKVRPLEQSEGNDSTTKTET
jgi:flagellar biosynthesis protein